MFKYLKGWKFLTGVLLAATGGVSVLAQPRPAMIAPIFPVQYDSAAIHFDPVPAVVSHLCPFVRKYEGRAWLYAAFQFEDREYYVVSGLLRGGDTGEIEADETGAAVEIHGGKCSMVDADWATTGVLEPGSLPKEGHEMLPGLHAPRVCVHGECHYVLRSQREKEVLDGLLSDALSRLARAFGGREKLLTAFRQQMPDPKYLNRAVCARLEEYEKN
jgi:hypothetical protein